MTDLQRILADLEYLFDLKIVNGTIALNVHEGEIKSIKTEKHIRVDTKSKTL